MAHRLELKSQPIVLGPPLRNRDLWPPLSISSRPASSSLDLVRAFKMSKVAIVHMKKPNPRVDEFVRDAKNAGEAAKVWVEVVTSIIGAGGGGSTGPGGTGPGGPTQPPR